MSSSSTDAVMTVISNAIEVFVNQELRRPLRRSRDVIDENNSDGTLLVDEFFFPLRQVSGTASFNRGGKDVLLQLVWFSEYTAGNEDEAEAIKAAETMEEVFEDRDKIEGLALTWQGYTQTIILSRYIKTVVNLKVEGY